jgi:peptidoglycan hydrolase CwlO-like protein
LIVSLLFTSCGPGKKLVASRAKVEQLQKDSANMHNSLNDCNAQVKSLNDQKSSFQNENAAEQNDLNGLSKTMCE